MNLGLNEWLEDDPPDGLFWLASFPRSGVTMLRIMLYQNFGLRSISLYQEHALGKKFMAVTGDVATAEEAHIVASRQGIVPVKTHRLPRDVAPGRAIVVVRDGRAIMSSLREFYASICLTILPMEKIIRGEHPWGDWTEWIKTWRAEERETLWLKYEEMVCRFDAQVNRIGEFIGRKPANYKRTEFRNLRQINPWMFRRGKMDHTLKPEEEELFWELHAETMDSLGYLPAGQAGEKGAAHETTSSESVSG